MLAVLLLLVCLFINSVTSTVEYVHHTVKPCHIGDVVQNECNKCLCTSKTVFECTPTDCNKTKIEESKGNTSQICLPNQLYVQNLITCICTKDGKWPHQSCQETFLSLPASSVVKHQCDPDTYVILDCNVCRCGPDGEFLSNRCTKNTCGDDISRRHHKNASNKKHSVYSTCKSKTWYSLAPCQFCYCVNKNKLVCNTGNDQTKKLELGTYDMQICGLNMIQEALELLPASEANLREGEEINTNVIPKPVPETTTVKIVNKINKAKLTNEKKEVAEAPKAVQDVEDKEEYYSDTEEGTVTNKITTTTASNIQPSESNVQSAQSEGSVEENENSNTEEDNSNELSANVDHLAIPADKKSKSKHPQNRLKRRTKMAKKTARTSGIQNINLPDVLNKMFSRVKRKSMVSLDVVSQCTPGSTSSDGCNMCFCLKNGKLLCSSHC